MKKASPKAEKPAVYDHKAVEKKWQKYWESKKSFQAKEDQEKKKFYALIEFPYPSGEGLHVGHIRSNTAMDVVARKRRAEGYNVLYPIGWDAFGLPTENYAIKTGIQPAIVTKKNTDIFRKQLKALGFSFDWSREIDTTDPAYYKWTQWIFLQFLKKGLAYKKKMTINWCPKDLIGLANEEVVNGCCERCGTPVEKRDKEQWMLAITKYADRLDKDLDDVDFLERIKIQQRNWIGKSEGAEIGFPIRQKKNFVLLHGFTATPEDDFHPWLKKKLESLGYRVQVPRLPHTDNPTEKEQVDFVRSSVQFDEGTILLGHSLGSVIALKILEKLDKKIAGLVTVGGFVDTDFKDHHRNFEKTFNWNFDFNKIKSNTGFIHVLHDTNDVAIKNSQAKRLAQALGVSVHECVANDSHFTAKKEPEVLNALILQIKVFTTRPDTLFGVTYLVLAPEHPLIGELLSSVENRKEVEDYIAKSRKETDIERTDTRKEKTGVQLKGIKAINPANNEEIPVWISDYVLADYGTGAVMAVPAHDERDWEFAKKFGLAVKEVVMPIRIDHTNPHVPGKKIVERRAIQAIVRNPKTGKILCLKWKKQPWTTFIVGGVEGNEDIVESARREVLEETGYKNLKFIRILGGTVKSEFFAAHKDENRIAYFNVIHFELENEEKNDIVSEELEKHEPIWLDVREIRPDTMQCGELDIWMHRLQSGNDASVEKGIMINSGQFNNKDSSSIKKEITEFVGGKWMTTYKLRDWIFSRQRYWGEPIPVVHCELHGIVPVPEKDLPVKLPKVKNYKPTETGESPLADISKWVNTKCPICKGPARRETDTMPNWAGSSWYYLRYADPKNKKVFADPKKLKYWTPVDWYNGGMEHTTLHLLYSRFWHKFLFDLGLVPTNEPYQKRTSHGLILAEGGEKMSKSKGNVINPDGIIEKVGADSLRLYEMFMGPFDQPIAWNTDNIAGVRRFIERVWKLREKIVKKTDEKIGDFMSVNKIIHKAIKKVSDDIEAMRFNTAISALMITLNELEKAEAVDSEQYGIFLQLLAPFAPHVADELWEYLGNKTSIQTVKWPTFDPTLAVDNQTTIVVQINGKMRGSFTAAMDAHKEELEKSARAIPEAAKWLEGKQVIKIVIVPNKLVNIVVK